MKSKKEGVSKRRYPKVRQCWEVKTEKNIFIFENDITGNFREKFTKMTGGKNKQTDGMALFCKCMLRKWEKGSVDYFFQGILLGMEIK